MIAWPALLHYAGQAELEYVADAASWQRLANAHQLRLHRDDRLIDSAGKLYRPIQHSDHIELQATGAHIALNDAISLIQQHQADAGQCCVAKFSAGSIAACIAALKHDS